LAWLGLSQGGASWGTGDLTLTTGKTYTLAACEAACKSNPQCNAITMHSDPWERQNLTMDIYSPAPAAAAAAAATGTSAAATATAAGQLQGAERRPAIVVIHGGGFIAGTRTNIFAVEEAQFYASHGYVAMSIDYRNDVRSLFARNDKNSRIHSLVLVVGGWS
jgi:acetyl esterase/lipase